MNQLTLKHPLKRHEPIKLASEAPLLLLEWIMCKISCWLRSTDDLLGGPPALLLPPLLGASVSCRDSPPLGAEDVSGDLWRPSFAAGVFMGRRAGELRNTFGVVTPRWTSEESSFPDARGCSWKELNVPKKSDHKCDISVLKAPPTEEVQLCKC